MQVSLPDQTSPLLTPPAEARTGVGFTQAMQLLIVQAGSPSPTTLPASATSASLSVLNGVTVPERQTAGKGGCLKDTLAHTRSLLPLKPGSPLTQPAAALLPMHPVTVAVALPLAFALPAVVMPPASTTPGATVLPHLSASGTGTLAAIQPKTDAITTTTVSPTPLPNRRSLAMNGAPSSTPAAAAPDVAGVPLPPLSAQATLPSAALDTLAGQALPGLDLPSQMLNMPAPLSASGAAAPDAWPPPALDLAPGQPPAAGSLPPSPAVSPAATGSAGPVPAPFPHANDSGKTTAVAASQNSPHGHGSDVLSSLGAAVTNTNPPRPALSGETHQHTAAPGVPRSTEPSKQTAAPKEGQTSQIAVAAPTAAPAAIAQGRGLDRTQPFAQPMAQAAQLMESSAMAAPHLGTVSSASPLHDPAATRPGTPPTPPVGSIAGGLTAAAPVAGTSTGTGTAQDGSSSGAGGSANGVPERSAPANVSFAPPAPSRLETSASAPDAAPRPSQPATAMTPQHEAQVPLLTHARLMQTLSGSQMQVNLSTGDFGRITVHAGYGRNSLSAQISLEDAQLGNAIAAHLPSVEQHLRGEHGLPTTITVTSGNSSTGDQSQPGAEAQTGDARGGSRGRTTSATPANTANLAETPTPVTFPSQATTSRLNIRI